ncbi:MAG: 4-hydroxy-3-methylbut-2-enyl diphosphate reductase [Planctomycetota bacterium]
MRPLEDLMSNPLYVQKGFGLKAQIKGVLESDYHSGLVDLLRERDYTLKAGEIEVRLAREFGFCYGVDRAVDLAYETREHFPERTIYITNEIIHNPYVNRRLVEMGIRFLGDSYSLDDVTAEDVVILPAFGVTTTDLDALRARGCVLVDTTCGSVLNVWRRVRQYAKRGFTALIHGKYAHEETRATCSQATADGVPYIVVRDKAEAELVCARIRGDEGALSDEAFTERFHKSVSEGFDPSRDLEHVGVANQTTMLSTESLEIAAMVGRALEARHGAEGKDAHFMSFDTICSATQDRQDAMLELGEAGGLDVLLVIGGYNSSNTMNLAIMGERFAPTYHINSAEEIHSQRLITHHDPRQKARRETENWLPPGPVTVGVTAGASTPNRTVGEVISRVLEVRGVHLRDDRPRPLPLA